MQWKTLATFKFVSEALGLKTRLESEGIEVLIPEEHTASINPMATAMTVRLQVKESDLPAALRICQAETSSHTEQNDTHPCPHCGSPKLKSVDGEASNWLRALLGFLLLIPMRRRRQRWVCEDCGAKI